MGNGTPITDARIVFNHARWPRAKAAPPQPNTASPKPSSSAVSERLVERKPHCLPRSPAGTTEHSEGLQPWIRASSAP